MNPADIMERLREDRYYNPDFNFLAREAADEIERLRELFRKDGEDHAAHVKGLVEQHETRMTRYADEIERLRKINTKLQRDLSDRISDIFEHDAEIERLRAARNDALGEAAKVAWEHDDDVGAVIADAIRALKEKTDEPG